MLEILQSMIFERGPMPFVSIATAIIAIFVVVIVRPRTAKAYLITLAICLIPFLAGIAGYAWGIHLAESDWQVFISGNVSAADIEAAKPDLEIGKQAAWDPFYLGSVLAIPGILLNTIIFLARRGN